MKLMGNVILVEMIFSPNEGGQREDTRPVNSRSFEVFIGFVGQHSVTSDLSNATLFTLCSELKGSANSPLNNSPLIVSAQPASQLFRLRSKDLCPHSAEAPSASCCIFAVELEAHADEVRVVVW